MKILITGIGNIGKSTLRERVANKFPGKIVQVDMDYAKHEDMPRSNGTDLLVEDVHGLERNTEQYDQIIYLLPPSNHILLWLKRGWAWFSGGVVDLSDPKGVNKKYAISNIPIILRILLRNILFWKKWLLSDLEVIETKHKSKTLIVKDVDTGVREATNILRRGGLC